MMACLTLTIVASPACFCSIADKGGGGRLAAVQPPAKLVTDLLERGQRQQGIEPGQNSWPLLKDLLSDGLGNES